MRLISAAARRSSAANRTPMRLATVLLAAVGASGPAEAQYQPDASIGTGAPGFRGLRLPGRGGIDVGAPGRAGWWSSTSITTRATATNNANYGESAAREGDLIIDLIPGGISPVGCAAARRWLRLARMIGYVWGVQTSRILPQANVLANLEAIENLFFIDGSVVANQSIVNPFLPRAEFSSTNNQYTYAQTRLAAVLHRQLRPQHDLAD